MERVVGGVVYSPLVSAFFLQRTLNRRGDSWCRIYHLASRCSGLFWLGQYWHAFEAIFLVVRRASCNSAAGIGLLVVDGGVPGMAAVLIPLCSTMKQRLLVHRPHVESQAHKSRYSFETTEMEMPRQGTGRKTNETSCLKGTNVTKAERQKQTPPYFEEARLLNH